MSIERAPYRFSSIYPDARTFAKSRRGIGHSFLMADPSFPTWSPESMYREVAEARTAELYEKRRLESEENSNEAN